MFSCHESRSFSSDVNDNDVDDVDDDDFINDGANNVDCRHAQKTVTLLAPSDDGTSLPAPLLHRSKRE